MTATCARCQGPDASQCVYGDLPGILMLCDPCAAAIDGHPDEWTALTGPVCGCESEDCGHPYLSVPAGSARADYVGAVCDACAATHLAPYVIA